MRWASRFTDTTRQAAEYRVGRVFLVARVLQASRAQGVLLVPDEDVTALREVSGELVDRGALAARVAAWITGTGCRGWTCRATAATT